MPCRPSTSASSTRLPCRARASARAAATVVLPVPPLPVTTCSRTPCQSGLRGGRAGVMAPSLGGEAASTVARTVANAGCSGSISPKCSQPATIVSAPRRGGAAPRPHPLRVGAGDLGRAPSSSSRAVHEDHRHGRGEPRRVGQRRTPPAACPRGSPPIRLWRRRGRPARASRRGVEVDARRRGRRRPARPCAQGWLAAHADEVAAGGVADQDRAVRRGSGSRADRGDGRRDVLGGARPAAAGHAGPAVLEHGDGEAGVGEGLRLAAGVGRGRTPAPEAAVDDDDGHVRAGARRAAARRRPGRGPSP